MEVKNRLSVQKKIDVIDGQKNKKHDKVKMIVNSETPYHPEIDRMKSMVSSNKHR